MRKGRDGLHVATWSPSRVEAATKITSSLALVRIICTCMHKLVSKLESKLDSMPLYSGTSLLYTTTGPEKYM